MPKGFRSICIRNELIDKIEEHIRNGLYKSIAEFISEAVRLRLQELEREAGGDE